MAEPRPSNFKKSESRIISRVRIRDHHEANDGYIAVLIWISLFQIRGWFPYPEVRLPDRGCGLPIRRWRFLIPEGIVYVTENLSL